MTNCPNCNYNIYPQVFEENFILKGPQLFDASFTGVLGFFRVTIESLNGIKFIVSTSSGALSLNAESIFLDGVELLDLTIEPLGSEELAVYVKIEGGE